VVAVTGAGACIGEVTVTVAIAEALGAGAVVVAITGAIVGVEAGAAPNEHSP